jgi:hypothetical protein
MNKFKEAMRHVVYVVLISFGLFLCIATPIALIRSGETGVYAWVGSFVGAIGFTLAISVHYYLTVLKPKK